MSTSKKDSKPKKAIKKNTNSQIESKPIVSKEIVKETVVEETVVKETVVKETVVEKTVVEETDIEETDIEETDIEETVVEKTTISPEEFLKDFDWENFEEGIETVDEKKLVELEKLIKENFVDTYKSRCLLEVHPGLFVR